MKTISLENSFIKIIVSDEYGAKILSILSKEENFNFVFEKNEDQYRKPNYGDSFEDYDTSGIDECFPTIDSCKFDGKTYTDHGDLWTEKWDNSLEDGKIISKVQSKSSGLNFKRTLSLEEKSLVMDYKIENPNDYPVYYLYTIHPLLKFYEDTVLELPYKKDGYINVMDEKDSNFHIEKLKEYKDKKAYKFYNKEALEYSYASLFHEDKNLGLRIDFDKEKFPYFALWVTKGGFKGEYNLAFEPCNGYYDSLDRAVSNGLRPLGPKCQDEFTLKFTISRR